MKTEKTMSIGHKLKVNENGKVKFNGNVPKKGLPYGHEAIAMLYITYEYDDFKEYTGNRPVDPLHLARLLKSFAKKHLIVPVIVNEKFEVIDGQHRIEAARVLNKPVYYIINQGYGSEEMQMLNLNNKTWGPKEFGNYYRKKGLKPYKIYNEFIIKHGFGHQETIALLTGTTINLSKMFNEGQLVIKDLEEATVKINRIKDFAEYYKGYKRKAFVFSMFKLFRDKNYNHKEMLLKVSMQPRKMVNCVDTKQYLEMFEEIYNFKRRGEKIRFTN